MAVSRPGDSVRVIRPVLPLEVRAVTYLFHGAVGRLGGGRVSTITLQNCLLPFERSITVTAKR